MALICLFSFNIFRAKLKETITTPPKTVRIIMEEPLPAMCPKFYHDPRQHCSRTFGHNVRKVSNKATKYPHRVIMQNKKQKSEKIDKIEKTRLGHIETEREETTDFGKITHVTSLKNNVPQNFKPQPIIQLKPKKPETITVDVFRDFKLTDKPKGSFMFVHWTIIRYIKTDAKKKIIGLELG